jgi:riboflavin synthase
MRYAVFMFTGIIKEVGRVQKLVRSSSLTKLGISSKALYEDINISDSVSCNGACLTVTDKNKGIIFFDAIKPTLEKTNLRRLRIGEFINLEPSLKLQDKLGGHFVLGHIDSEARLKKIINKTGTWQLEIDLPLAYKKFIVENGSVAIEGISLTVKKLLPRSFTVDIIPFTYENTNLKYKRTGDWLNVEFDYLLKKY